MDNSLIIVKVGESKDQRQGLIYRWIEDSETTYQVTELMDLRRHRLKETQILWHIHLQPLGVNPDIEQMVAKIWEWYNEDKNIFSNSVGGVYISSDEEDFTKQSAANLVHRLNKMGLRFPGRPLVEAPLGLQNYKSYVKRNGLSLQENLKKSFFELIHNMETLFVECQNTYNSNGKHNLVTEMHRKKAPKLLVLHSSNKESNTLALWNMIKEQLKYFEISEISLANGQIMDCKACGYTICKHYSKQESCYYGGIMVDNVYPAIIEAEGIVLLCPNYNDAITANITAMINRLTALFRNHKFFDKKMYAVIVSGSSGNEAIATQLIRALNMNKTFQLPPYFSISAIAYDRGDIFQVEGIQDKICVFSQNVIAEFLR